MGRLTSTIHLFFHVMETALQLEIAIASRTTDRGSFITILTLVLVSSAVVNMASLFWIHKVMDFTGRTAGQALCILLHILQLGPLWRYFKLIVLGETRDEEEFHTLRLCQVALQNAPFIVIQGYFLVSGKDSVDCVFSIVVALLSLTFAITCYENRSQHNTGTDLHKNIKSDPKFVLGTGLQFLSHMFVLTSRFLALTLFTDKLLWWIILLLGGHLVIHFSIRCVMALYSKDRMLNLKTQGMPLFILDTFVQAWDNLNANTDRPVHGMLLIYLVFLIENICMSLVWFLGRESSSRTVIILVLMFAPLLLGCLLAVLVRQLVKNHYQCTTTTSHLKIQQHRDKSNPRHRQNKSVVKFPDEELGTGDAWSEKHCFINSVFDLDFDPVPLTPTSYMSKVKSDKKDSLSSVSVLCVDVKPPSTFDESTSGQARVCMEEHTSPDSGVLSLGPVATDQDYASSVSRNTNTLLDTSTSSSGREASSEASSSELMKSIKVCKHQQNKQDVNISPFKHHSVNRCAGRAKSTSDNQGETPRTLSKSKGEDKSKVIGSSSSEFTSENEYSPVESGIHSSDNLHSHTRRMRVQHCVRRADDFDWVCDDVTCTSDSSDSYYYHRRRHRPFQDYLYKWEESCSDSYSESFCYTYDLSSSSSSSTNTFDMDDSELGCALTWPPRKRITIVNLGNLPKEQVSAHDNVCSWLSQTQTFSPQYQPAVQGRRAMREARMHQVSHDAVGSGLVTQNCYRRACSVRAKRRHASKNTRNEMLTKMTYLAQKKRKKRHILLTLCSIRTKKPKRFVDMMKGEKTGNLTDQLIKDDALVVDRNVIGTESSV